MTILPTQSTLTDFTSKPHHVAISRDTPLSNMKIEKKYCQLFSEEKYILVYKHVPGTV